MEKFTADQLAALSLANLLLRCAKEMHKATPPRSPARKAAKMAVRQCYWERDVIVGVRKEVDANSPRTPGDFTKLCGVGRSIYYI